MLIENITTLVTTPGSGDDPKTTEDCQSKYTDFNKSGSLIGKITQATWKYCYNNKKVLFVYIKEM